MLPFGEMFGMATVMDKSLEPDAYLVFQAGHHHQAVRMAMDSYRRLARPKGVQSGAVVAGIQPGADAGTDRGQ